MPSLGNDLATIRKELNITIEDIHNATKIPTHILHSIEDDSIFEDLDRNATYIRSYVRSFAKELEIDKELIVRALDQVEFGNYSGLLREEADGKASPKFQTRHQEKKPQKPKDDKEEPIKKTDPIKEPSEPETRPEPTKTQKKSAGTPTIQSVDWVDMGRRFTPLKSKSRIWAGLIILVVAVLSVSAVIYFFNRNPQLSGSSSQGSGPLTTADAVEADSLQLNLTDSDNADDSVQTRQTRPAEALADTLNLVIYAAYDKLEPVRVYTDVMASLNPYWIELGEAVRFKFVNTLRIRGPYNRMVLLLNGHVIENFTERFLNRESGLVEINRQAFEGESKWLQPPPDSLGLDVPDPATIKDQPIFN